MNEEEAADALRPALLGRLEREKAAQLLFLQTTRDAAILAGEQVQDVRLDVLDQPPAVSASDVLLDVLISLAFGTAAPKALQAFTKGGARAILASRRAVAKKNGAFALVPFTINTLQDAQLAAVSEVVEDLVDPKKAQVEYWKSVAQDILGIPVSKVESKAHGALKDDAGASGATSALKGGDSASVAVRRAALSSCRLQERAVDQQFTVYENQIRSDTTTHKELLAINNLLFALANGRASSFPKSNEEIERELSLFFEAGIWLLHVGGVEGITERATETSGTFGYYPYGAPVRPSEEYRYFSDKKAIVKYWLRRFPHDKGNGTDSFLLHVIRGGNRSPVVSALTDMTEWFAKLASQTTALQRKLPQPVFEALGAIKLK